MRIIVIGKNSYIGKAFCEYAGDGHEIITVSSRNREFNNTSFAGADSVLFCAGIAHIKMRKENEALYYEVNCDLALEAAKKAKAEGVPQFIYLSSVAAIEAEDYYGRSKLLAEQRLKEIEGGGFCVCIIRPPMVYGFGCRGNFQKLLSLARFTPVFPDIINRRSMIFIDNLSQFILRAVEKSLNGVFLPQNREYVCTTELVRLIAKSINKKIMFTKLFNPIIIHLSKYVKPLNKMFGDLTFEYEDIIEENVGFAESVEKSIKG